MGCGKSTLGKKLANKLKIEFIDSDAEIEKKVGCTINEIFDTKGEEFFRNLEKEFLENLNLEKNFVLSTGGGMPCNYFNIDLLNQIGTTFYLKLSAFELTQRLLHSKKARPLTVNKNEDDLYQYIKSKLSERIPFYEKANFKIKGKEQNPTFIFEKLKEVKG